MNRLTSQFLKTSSNQFSRRFASTKTQDSNAFRWKYLLGGLGLGCAAGGLAYNSFWVNAKEKVRIDEDIPGESKSFKKKGGEWLSEVVQPYAPTRAIGSHTDEILWISGEPKRQMEAHALCTWLNDDVAQCLLYDSEKKYARLIGVEYTISERLFKGLPAEEQKLWASNQYEVKDGLVVAPRLPKGLEKEMMEDLANTYSKSLCTWQVDRDYLPVGVPQLFFTLTERGPEPDRTILERRKKHNADPIKLRDERADIEVNPPHPNADIWKTGQVPVLTVTYKKLEWKSPALSFNFLAFFFPIK
jgi:hypothetical protein